MLNLFFDSLPDPHISRHDDNDADDERQEHEEQLDADTLDQTLSVDYQLHMLGGCFYSHRDQKLLVMEDLQTQDPQVEIEKMIIQMNPAKVLVNGSVDKGILDMLEKEADQMGFQFTLKPSGEFHNPKYDMTWLFSKYPVNELDSKILVRTPCLVEINNLHTNTTFEKRGTLAVLMKYLEDKIVMSGLKTDLKNIIINVELFILDDYMYIDQDSMAALQIFSSSNGAKSTLNKSLFQLISFTGSEVGRKRLYSWFLRPLANIALIKERQRNIRHLLQEENTQSVQSLRSSMKNVVNINNIISVLISGSWNYNSWLNISKFINEAFEIYHNVSNLTGDNEETTFFDSMLDSIELDQLNFLKNVLSETLDVDLTRELKTPTILDGVDSNLDEYRRGYNEMDQNLKSIAVELVKDLPEYLAPSLNVAYIPQLGYLIQIDALSELINFAINSEWNEIFSSGKLVYYKNGDMEELDSHYGDIYSLMCDCEIEIVQNLSNTILNHQEMLINFLDKIATMDCFLALTKAANVLNYNCPEMVDEVVFDIEQSRHPIYEHSVDTFIPNDAQLGNQVKGKIMVITGANLSGKSVYLTQVGLIVFLAHIGSFVPAEKAKIGICDRILTRLISRETLSKQSSTFLTDVQQMEKCLRLMTPKSLLLIDEFGKGTDLNDGPALFGAVLKYMSQLDTNCPRAITATHFHELFADDSIREFLNLQNAIFYNMNITMVRSFDNVTKRETNEISYLFKLKKGLAKESFGIYCAKICGIDREIVERAQLFVNLLERGENVIHFCNQISEDESRYLVLLEYAIKEFIMWDLEGTELSINEVHEKLNHILSTLD